jgi:Fic family protein
VSGRGSSTCESSHGGKTNLLAIQLLERLPHRPIIDMPWVVNAIQTTKPTAGRAIDALKAAGVLVEFTGKKRDRVYA